MEFDTKFVPHGRLQLPQVKVSVLDFELMHRLPLASIISPPPEVFEKQLAKVLVWAELREERAAEILTQIENQYCIWGSIVPLPTMIGCGTRRS